MAQRTLLFVDDRDVLYRPGTKRVLHPLTRHPQNPLIAGNDRPWEVAIGWNSVYRDPGTGSFQLWYQAFAGHTARERTHRCVVCYAESEDGLSWVKPDLGLHRFNDSRETNIVLLANGGTSDRYGASVLVDPLDADPARRYKMAYYDFSVDQGHEYPGLSVAFSPDGIHWTKHPHAPLLRASYGSLGDPLPYADKAGQEWTQPLAMSDAVDAIYDPRRGAFVIYGKMWIDGPDGRLYWKHAMGRSQSQDFIHWSRPELVLTADEFDPPHVEFHTAPVFCYNERYFALLQILHRAERGGVMDIELAVSKNGMRWDRPFRRPFFLPKNEGQQFDSGSVLTNATPVLLEDEFRFYYAGYSEGATGGDDYALLSGIGLATMPRDRFAGLLPMDGMAQVTLRPIKATGGAISLNADASAGTVQVEVLDAEGRRVRGFAQEDAVPITGDGLRHPVRWKGHKFAELPAGAYMLRLHMNDAEVFAVEVG
jgi:hypothetical protein